jgi:DNA polymerase (family X)
MGEMDKHEIAQVFEEIATLLELKGDNPFKIRAYRNAAKQIEGADLPALVKSGSLTSLEGVGKDLAEKITTLYQTGHLEVYEQLKKSVPEGLFNLLGIPGLGPKKIKALYEELNVTSLEALKTACLKAKVRELKGFSEKTEKGILQGIEHLTAYGKRMLWWDAEAFGAPLLAELKKRAAHAEIAGSFRRKLETVGDLDFLAASPQPAKVIDWFTSNRQVTEVLSKGGTKSSVRLSGGFQADLRVVSLESYPFALHYFTGSKEHNIKIRKMAHDLGYRLNEWGLEKLDGKAAKHRIKSEEDLYKFFGLSYIPPELREDRGEIEAIALPKLVTEEDIRGVFHNHTTDSDGHNTLEEMARAAEELNFSYLGIADHSPSSRQANGLSEERLIAQIEKIRKMNRSKKFSVHLFAGTECDILNDGSLDWPDELLKELDYVVVSIHSGFKMDEKTITKRMIKAIEHPLSTMVGHLTGRLLLKREPYPINAQKVIDAAIANGKIIEINAQPERLDMDWRLWHAAKEKGLKCSINTDAHSTDGLRLFRAGVNVARKGWLEKSDVINTYSLKKVKDHFSK